MGKKNVKRKKYFRVVNVLKESIGVITIRKRILDLGASLTVVKLLVFAPVVKKQLIKAISKLEII